ncbi:MAG: sulfotransferase [Proteobacteria bacterium]|nr:sulfotransferase [Pseudomonadota bacterium]
MPTSLLPIDAIATALQQGRARDAEQLTRTYLTAAPADTDALLILALCLQEQNRLPEATQIHRDLIRLQPEIASHWNNLGTTLRAEGLVREAEDAYRHARMLAPNDYAAAMNLGLLFLERDMYPQAQEQFLAAHVIDADSVEARIYAARMCYALDAQHRAEQLLASWRTWHDLSDDLRLELAVLISHFGDGAEGLQLFARLLQDNPQNHRAIANLAALQERLNRLDDARATLACLSPPDAVADAALAREILSVRAMLALREPDAALARNVIEALLAEQQRIHAQYPHDSASKPQADLYFALAKICDKLGDVDAAMAALRQAHALQLDPIRKSLPELLAPDAELLHTATKWLDASAIAAWPQWPAPPLGESPVFIVGFPRSGTTMLEQMLDAHPHLKAMDERAFLQVLVERMGSFGLAYPFDLGKLSAAQCSELRELYWHLAAKVAPCTAGQRLVDKNPLNMLRLPLIHRLFPNAPIVLALRHPCDVILSNYMQHFNSNTFAVLCSNLDRLAQGYVTAFESCLHHVDLLAPKLMRLRYEDLLDDFPGNVSRLGAFLELEDAAVMSHFAEHARNKGYISTPSYSQVIEPPNKNAVGRWRRYTRYLEPALPILQPLMQRFGYDA